MTILINKATVEDINAALIRLKKTFENEQASLANKVTNIVSTQVNGSQYNDSELRRLIDAIESELKALTKDVDRNRSNITINKNNISELYAMLRRFNIEWDEPILTFTDFNGNSTEIEITDTTYTFEYNSEDNSITITNDATGEEFTFAAGCRYIYSFNDGTLTIYESANNGDYDEIFKVNFDDRYYTKNEIDVFINDIKATLTQHENKINDLENRVKAIEDAPYATESFVNSSIATATATFRGTYDSYNELRDVSGDLNDYAFIHTDTGYDRYKYVVDANPHWVYEYTLNNSSFTDAQWAAINSGITCSLVCKITDVYNCTVTICQGGTCKGSFTLNQSSNGTITLDSAGSSCRITICQGNTCKGSFTLNQNCNSSITLDAVPTVYNCTVTICQGTTCKGSFTLNKNGNTTITLDAIPTVPTVYNCKICIYEGTTCKGGFTLNQSSNGSVCLTDPTLLYMREAVNNCQYNLTLVEGGTCYKCAYRCNNIQAWVCDNIPTISLNNGNVAYTLNGFSFTNNDAQAFYYLLYDITDWAVCNNVRQEVGINGTLIGTRPGGYSLETQMHIIANIHYCRNNTAWGCCNVVMTLLYSNPLKRNYTIVPAVVCGPDNKYYLALCGCAHMSTRYTFTGTFNSGDYLGRNLLKCCVLASTTGWAVVIKGCTLDNHTYVSNTTANNNVPIVLSPTSGLSSLCRGTTLTYNPSSCILTTPYISTNGKCIKCVVHVCVLPSPANTRVYYQIKQTSTSSDRSPSVYSWDIYQTKGDLRLDNNKQYYCGNENYGGFQYAVCNYTVANCNCFWVSYTSYRPLTLCSAADFEVICCTTTAPTGITFLSPIYLCSRIMCCNTTGNANYDLLLGNAHDTCNNAMTQVLHSCSFYANPSTGVLYSNVFCSVGSDLNGNRNTCTLYLCRPLGCDVGILLNHPGCYNIGMELGSGNANRGIYHKCGSSWGTFQWLLYWSSDSLERHNCTIWANMGICSGYYITTPTEATYSIPANSSVYIRLGCFKGSQYVGEMRLSWGLGGGSLVETGVISILPTAVSMANHANAGICIRQTDFVANVQGVQQVLFVGSGTAWNCYSTIWLRVCNPYTAACSWKISLYRDQIYNNWYTALACQATAPTGCQMLTVCRPYPTACNWEWSNVYKQAVPIYSGVCGASVAVGSCCRKTLVICTGNCNVYKKMLISICSSCATSYRSVMYLDVIKDGANNTYNINACFGNANCDMIMPYRVSASGSCVLIDVATCTDATLLANVSIRCDNSAYGITCSNTVNITGMSWQNYTTCTWPTSVSINTNHVGQTLTNVLSANVVTACCIAATSALELKCDIEPHIGCALCLLNNTCIYDYRYKTDEKDSIKRVGIIADWTNPVLSGERQDHFDISNATGLLIKAVQELNDKLENKWYKRLYRWFCKLIRVEKNTSGAYNGNKE